MKRALVLSGGGSHSAFEAGAIDFLVREAGLDFDIFTGTSAGALNVAVLGAAHNYRELVFQTQELKQLWLGVKGNHSVYRKNLLGWIGLLFNNALYHPAGLKRMLRQYIDPAVICHNQSKFIKVATVAIETGELFFADSRQDNLQGHMIDYILASASIPPFFPPVFINKKHWFDGGLRDITPLGAAFQENPDEIIVILTFPVNSQLEPILPQVSYPGVLQSLLRALHILTTEISTNDLQYAQLVNTYYRLFPGRRRVPIRIISPSKPLSGDILDFDPSTIRINIKEGYEAARNLLKENPQIITTIS